jgi:fructuronate reductase
MKLNLENLNNKTAWQNAGVKLPQYDIAAMRERTKAAPVWVHFGAGNIFRGFIAALQQTLLNMGVTEKGIVAVETFDYDIVDKIYAPFDNLALLVTLNPDATTDRTVIASIAEAVKADEGHMARLAQIFADPGLQMASFTITEKGYALRGLEGNLMPLVQADMAAGPAGPQHVVSIVTALLHCRYQAGPHPLALVSMDNCSRNGEKLGASVREIAAAWQQNGYVDQGFVNYVNDESQVAFPWSMIDKITPFPAKALAEALEADGIAEMQPIVTAKNTYIAPFVNAERPQYLVIEDGFPNGRPPLEKAGVYITDRETVSKTERMKVTTCLNPLHTAMSVFGCLLGFTSISAEMGDDDIVALIRRLAYQEGLPVVTDPGIISPAAFLNEVVSERLPNPFVPDSPQRIVVDTSQKVGIRFGETILSYVNTGRSLDELVAIPLALAGWFRYLLAVDDSGEAMEVAPDPLKEELQAKLAGIVWNEPGSYKGQLGEILDNAAVFGLDLTQTVLKEKIERYFVEMLAGKGAVRKVLGEM